MSEQQKQTGSITPPNSDPKQSSASISSLLASDKIMLRDLGDAPKPLNRQFPGPRNAEAALRVAVEKRAHAELIAHAKESLEVEVCGVLVGEVCEDAEGLFVHVEAIIRGTAATEASTHVTFTQATWNTIYRTLEHDFPKLRIVGWYHTHPGFGVEFSDMDLFIQKNFFSASTQIALVTDPLSGAMAICLNTPQGARYLPRFWVDGREQLCRVPSSRQNESAQTTDALGGEGLNAAALRGLEARLAQLVQVIDEQQASYHRFLLFCGIIFCLAIIGSAGYFIYSIYTSKFEPPKLNSYVPIPVQVGDKTALVGIGVVDWKIPDEMNALMLQMELLKKIAAEKEAAKSATNAAADSNNLPAAATNTEKKR